MQSFIKVMYVELYAYPQFLFSSKRDLKLSVGKGVGYSKDVKLIGLICYENWIVWPWMLYRFNKRDLQVYLVYRLLKYELYSKYHQKLIRLFYCELY